MAGMTAATHPPLPSRFWADLSTRDFTGLRASGQARQTVAVLPVAAIEQHGPHLPLSVDATLLQGVMDAALQLLPAALPVLFLPPQVVGLSPEHIRFPGTLTLSPATVIALWTEIGECVARELRTRSHLLAYSASWFSLPLPDAVAGQFSAEEHRFGIHAGEIETSMMLHLAPSAVHMEHARDFRSTSQDRAERYAILGNGKSAKLGWQMQDYHVAGAVGNAAAATADKGRAVVDAAAQQLVRLLQELHDLPLATLVDGAGGLVE